MPENTAKFISLTCEEERVAKAAINRKRRQLSLRLQICALYRSSFSLFPFAQNEVTRVS